MTAVFRARPQPLDAGREIHTEARKLSPVQAGEPRHWCSYPRGPVCSTTTTGAAIHQSPVRPAGLCTARTPVRAHPLFSKRGWRCCSCSPPPAPNLLRTRTLVHFLPSRRECQVAPPHPHFSPAPASLCSQALPLPSQSGRGGLCPAGGPISRISPQPLRPRLLNQQPKKVELGGSSLQEKGTAAGAQQLAPSRRRTGREGARGLRRGCFPLGCRGRFQGALAARYLRRATRALPWEGRRGALVAERLRRQAPSCSPGRRRGGCLAAFRCVLGRGGRRGE